MKKSECPRFPKGNFPCGTTFILYQSRWHMPLFSLLLHFCSSLAPRSGESIKVPLHRFHLPAGRSQHGSRDTSKNGQYDLNRT